MSKQTNDPIIRTSLSLRQSLWREIEEYRDRERIVTTADAVRRLLSSTLAISGKKALQFSGLARRRRCG